MILNSALFKSKYVRWIVYPLLPGFVVYQYLGQGLFAAPQNGFDLTSAIIPKEEIYHGGPARDGIPALDYPQFIKPGEANYLKPSDRVLGITLNGVTKAYSVSILNYHEIVNDHLGDEPVVIAYCPLCGSGTAYLSIVDGKPLTFGVSGLLYNNDILLYDRKTESLWSQLLSRAISGQMRGKRLQQIPVEHTTWSDWYNRYPETQVMSLDTGHNRDYSRSPYGEYATNESIYFPVKIRDRRYHPKEQVIGVEVNGEFKAYPFSELARYGEVVTDTVGGEEIRIQFNGQHRSGRVVSANNQVIPSVIVYWFAWKAFHPETSLFKVEKTR